MNAQHVQAMHNKAMKLICALDKQCFFIDTRMMAFESVLGSRIAILGALFIPKWFRKELDKAHVDLMQKYSNGEKQGG